MGGWVRGGGWGVWGVERDRYLESVPSVTVSRARVEGLLPVLGRVEGRRLRGRRAGGVCVFGKVEDGHLWDTRVLC